MIFVGGTRHIQAPFTLSSRTAHNVFVIRYDLLFNAMKRFQALDQPFVSIC